MNTETFTALLNKRIAKTKKTLLVKAEEYAPNGLNRLSNFDDAANLLAVAPEQYALSLVTKHYVALKDMVMSGTPLTQEFIDEKIGDIVVYMILLEAIATERLER
jgi:hypothetical protein